jgi:hypothetical protein
LKADLDAVQPGLAQFNAALSLKANGAGDEIGVKPCGVCGGNQLRQVGPPQWFASREADVQNSHLRGFVKYTAPFLRR